MVLYVGAKVLENLREKLNKDAWKKQRENTGQQKAVIVLNYPSIHLMQRAVIRIVKLLVIFHFDALNQIQYSLTLVSN